MLPVLPRLTFVLPIMTGAPDYNIYSISQYPDLPISTGAHTTLSYSRKLFRCSHDLRAGRTTSNYRFSSRSSSDEERPPEGAHVASIKEEVHFPYQSRRGAHFWTPPLPVHMFLLPIATDSPITLCTPLSSTHFRYQSRRAHQKAHFGHPYTCTAPASKKKYISTTKHTLATPTHVQLSYSRNFYSISTYVTGHVTLGSA